MPSHTFPASAGGGGGALSEGSVFVRSGEVTSTTDSAGHLNLGPGGGTFTDPGGWYDDDEEALLLPEGLYQFDAQLLVGGEMSDNWRLIVRFGGDTIDRKLVVPAVLLFGSWSCGTTQVIHVPEPVFVFAFFGRDGTTLANVAPLFRIAELV